MASTALKRTKRYIRPGISVVHYLPACADYTAPTRQEIDGGTELSAEISEISGFSVTSDTVETPDWASRFTSKVPGMISAEDSSITFYGSVDTDDVRSVLPRDTTGFIIIMDGGDVPEQSMDVFPVTVSSVAKEKSNDDPVTLEVSFTITDEPAEDVQIPASAV